MNVEYVKNKEGKSLVTKTGEPLTRKTLENKDLFMPKYNKPFEKKKEVVIDGKERVIREYHIEVEIDKVSHYVKLTHSQSLTLKNDTEEAVSKEDLSLLPKNNFYECYSYKNEHGMQLGIKRIE